MPMPLNTAAHAFAREITDLYPDAVLFAGVWTDGTGRAGMYAQAREAGKTPRAAAKLVTAAFE